MPAIGWRAAPTITCVIHPIAPTWDDRQFLTDMGTMKGVDMEVVVPPGAQRLIAGAR